MVDGVLTEIIVVTSFQVSHTLETKRRCSMLFEADLVKITAKLNASNGCCAHPTPNGVLTKARATFDIDALALRAARRGVQLRLGTQWRRNVGLTCCSKLTSSR